jgi:hypothetical protein
MRIGLNVGERLIVLNIIPKEGNFVTLRMIRTLINRLAPSAEEITEFEILAENNTVRWNVKGNVPIEFEFADAEVDLIKKELKRMDSENKLPMEVFPVYEKFCT